MCRQVSGAAQVRTLQNHTLSVVKLGGIVADFMKKKAAIQERCVLLVCERASCVDDMRGLFVSKPCVLL